MPEAVRQAESAARRGEERGPDRLNTLPEADEPGWYSRWAFTAPSRVAQLAEQPAVNRQVTGSSPVAGASHFEVPGQGSGDVVVKGLAVHLTAAVTAAVDSNGTRTGSVWLDALATLNT